MEPDIQNPGFESRNFKWRQFYGPDNIVDPGVYKGFPGDFLYVMWHESWLILTFDNGANVLRRELWDPTLAEGDIF